MDSRDTHSEPHSCAAEFLPTPTLQNIYWWSIIETAMGKKTKIKMYIKINMRKKPV